MKGPIAYMTNNHVAANLLMFVFLIGGLMIGGNIKQEVFPEFEIDMVTVTVAYPGATPAEVEDAIVRPVELAVSGIDGLKRIRSTSVENVGSVIVEVLEDADTDQVLADVKSEVDRITTFPEEAEKPVISKVTNRQEVVSIMVYGEASELALRQQAERLRDDLLATEGITQVDLAGVRPYEISIEIPEENLRKYNLTLNQVAAAVRSGSLDLAGGSLRTDGGEILIRTTEKRYTGAEYDSVVVLTRPDGRTIHLEDIGTVKDGFSELDQESYFDGKPAAMVKVYRVGDQTPKGVSNAVRSYLDQHRAGLPSSIKVAIWDDNSIILQQRMNLLLRNGLLGLALVMIILSLFLEIRLALWVASGILISFVGSLMLVSMFDVSINMISLFAFLIILGVVVDDAIVVGENIYVHRKMGKDHHLAAYDGTREVSMAVVFAGLTTVAAFGPLLFVGGFTGNFLGVVPIIVISVLVISLIDALFILPAHLSSRFVQSTAPIWQTIERQRSRVDGFVTWLVDKTYAGSLTWATRNRYLTLAIAIAMLLVTIGVLAGGHVKFNFMPEIDADEITATLEMPPGTPYDDTRAIAMMIQRHGEAAVAHFDSLRSDGVSEMDHIYTLVGQKSGQRTMGGSPNASASNIAEIIILLKDAEHRKVGSTVFAQEWRKRVGEVAGAEKLTFHSDLVGDGGDLAIQLSHSDYNQLLAAVDRLKENLSSYEGTSEVSDSYSEGKRELRLKLRPEAASLGITEQDLAMQVRSAFFGAEALRIQRGQDEVKVMVRYPEKDRETIATIDNMRIRTPNGLEVPFYQAAYVDEGRGYNTISRTDRRRVVDITAAVDKKTANANEILADLRSGLLPQLKSDYPGLTFDFEGRTRNQQEGMRDMGRAFAFGLFLIYALLAVPFRSFTQPMVVMSAIPFGIIGAIGGHLLLGYNLSMISMFGIVALSGVVVNSSLVMIDFINQQRIAGIHVRDAIVDSGKRRFRPIVMTSLTTFFGLMPMILETSIQARFLVPMAISLGFGVLFATAITLILVPSLYLILEDIHDLFSTSDPATLDNPQGEITTDGSTV